MAKQFSVSGPGSNPYKGSKGSFTGYLYVAVILFLAIAAGTLLSGGFLPVDPNGPYGPPTLPPYYGLNGVDQQEIRFPSAAPDPKDNLQLKTFSVNVCGSTSVFNFLIDTSASMQDDNKIEKLRSGLQAFVKQLAPSAVVGIQTFSGVVRGTAKLDYLKNNRTQVTAAVQGLSAEGWTRMRDGFQLAKAELATAVTSNKFPGYKYYLIVLSDGVPETPPPRTCKVTFPDPLWGPDGRCFTNSQDPRIPTNIADDIKSIGVDIYAVGIFSKAAVSDAQMKPYLDELLTNAVSAPASTHYFGTDATTVNISDVLKNLVSTLCQGYIGGSGSGTSPTPRNYPFPTYPNNSVNDPFDAPGGQFTN